FRPSGDDRQCRGLRFAAGQWSEAIDVSAVRVGGDKWSAHSNPPLHHPAAALPQTYKPARQFRQYFQPFRHMA
ncbi:MAG: hypothetical protein EBT84_13170, partial [Sphingomonadaceae bacterium]|nr:hypothetical protein [Sphingomonadaceae bacterium]